VPEPTLPKRRLDYYGPLTAAEAAAAAAEPDMTPQRMLRWAADHYREAASRLEAAAAGCRAGRRWKRAAQYGTLAHQTRGRIAGLAEARLLIAAADGWRPPDDRPDPELHEAQVSADLLRSAQDLYRGMNESLSQQLAAMPWQQRRPIFAAAQGYLDADQAAGKPLDLLRAFTEAVMQVEPGYSPDPTRPSERDPTGWTWPRDDDKEVTA
jgi:hypothetical protein